MPPDMWELYRQMYRSRLFEELVRVLWNDGLIFGEMHLGTGEEGIVAGILTQLAAGDALCLDHRATSALIMRGLDPVSLLREFLGQPDGLCSGMGGHMHLFSKSHLAASSGIVGSTGPAAAGFGLSAMVLRPGTVSIAFFGEGAINQGMLLESFNLAVVWGLPVLFVCKDNGWAITSRSAPLTGGAIAERARGFGMAAVECDGRQVEQVWYAAQAALERARTGGGPTFLHARCVHLEGHFLGDPILRLARKPVEEVRRTIGPMARSAVLPRGAPIIKRLQNLIEISGLGRRYMEENPTTDDPLGPARERLEPEAERLARLEADVATEMQTAVERALAPD